MRFVTCSDCGQANNNPLTLFPISKLNRLETVANPSPIEPKKETTLRHLAAERILVLDGAMGTMIQALGLDEEGYRGARFDAWNREVRGNNDLLNLSRPGAVRAIHLAYFRAGADIVSTNTFSSTRIAQADYGMAEIAHELNAEGARLAREAANVAQDEDGRPRFRGETLRIRGILAVGAEQSVRRHDRRASHMGDRAHALHGFPQRQDPLARPGFSGKGDLYHSNQQ